MSTNIEKTETGTKDQRGWLDITIGKLTSRKLLAWVAATTLLCVDKIDAGDWAMITLLWIGVQGVIDWYKIRSGISPRDRQDF